MSQPAGIESGNSQGQQQQVATGQQTQQTQQTQQQQGGKPYDQYLQKIPESLRPTVEPIFQEWDGNTTRKFQELQQQISGYQPYQDYFNNYEAEAIGEAIALAEGLSDENSARQIFQQLAQVLGYQIQDQNVVTQGQQQQQTQQQQFGFEDDNQPDVFSDPRFQKIEQGLGTVADMLLQQQQMQQEREQTAEVEREWNGLKEQNKNLFTNPDGSENLNAQEVVFALAINNGGDLSAAIETYKSTIGVQAAQQNTPGQQAPIIGGGAQNTLPTGGFDAAKLTPEQRKQLAVQALQAANRQQT